MGYRTYAGSPADFFADLRGDGTFIAQPFATAAVFDDLAGRPVTDLKDMNGAAIVKITADSAGNFEFQAPDTYGTLYVKPMVTGSRYYPVQPSRLGNDVLTYLQRVKETERRLDLQDATLDDLAPPAGYRVLIAPVLNPGVKSVAVVNEFGAVSWVSLSTLSSGTGGGGGGSTTPTAGPATFASSFADAKF